MMEEGDVISDGQAGESLHLVLAGGNDWRTPIQQLFNKNSGSEWAILVLELQSGSAHFEILTPNTKCTQKHIENTVLWLMPLCMEPPAKPRLVKKVLVKKSPETSTASSGNSTKTIKTSTGTKIIRKKIATKDGVIALNGDLKEKSSLESSGTAMKATGSSSNEKTTKSRELAKKAEKANGDGSSVDSGISLADSDNEKSQKIDVNIAEGDDRDKERLEMSMNEWVTPCTTPDSALKAVEAEASFVPKSGNIRQDEISTSFTVTLSSNEPMTSEKHRTGRMESIVEEDEKHHLKGVTGDGCEFSKTAQARLTNGHVSSDERCSPGLSSSSSRLSPPSYASDRVVIQQAASNERRKAPVLDISGRDMSSRGNTEMPVQVLQQVLKLFTYKELGEMRQVHPYWDELCGQALNSAYYELVRKADKMLTDCQRRVHNERELHNVLALLTNVQVHILNPIDILRPAMDEGVCCFIYGDLLDKIFAIVAKAKRMMNGEYDMVVDWKSVAELARRAQIHYKVNLEAAMEEKLSDVIKLKALQRIQRIDSFIVDSTVTKLEKAAHMARDDLEWEIEQLRQQNSQLRKDNRELKKDYMRLESRVEVLENKFKTIARLLQ
ncbi:unnamed protein product [Toxocara canis]|uniref:F-box domain-containing protein n=1 Tax=Toxocara canis TaxID=6265 RepID=A0A183UUI9_TOXCA|nr:unnamed protein product [Toxocara canis]